MKKLLTSLLAAIGLAGTASANEVISSPFERILLQAKQSQEYMPVWEAFVNTQFFVVATPMDSGETTKNFRFSIFNSPESKNQPMVIISESLDKLSNSSSDNAIKITGAKLVQMLNHEVGIVIAFSDGAFGIPKEQVQWLRESIQPVR